MVDLTYKKYTNKDYAVDAVYSLINKNNCLDKVEKKELRKLKVNTLLQILSKLEGAK